MENSNNNSNNNNNNNNNNSSNHIIVDHIGNYNFTNGQFQYFDNASKKRGQCLKLLHYKDHKYNNDDDDDDDDDDDNNDNDNDDNNKNENDYQYTCSCPLNDIEDYGYVVDFEDTLIDYTSKDVLQGANKKIAVNHIMLSNENPTRIIEDIESVLFYPSNIVEREYRAIIDKLKRTHVHQRDMRYMFQLWNEPKCGMGLTIKTSTGKSILVNNRVGNSAFNVFNSHFLGMEMHRDFDLLMSMACFLKYNCIWGGEGHAISLKNCDYAGVFMGKDSFVDEQMEKPERRTSINPYTFFNERAILMANYMSSKTRITDAVAIARSIDSEHRGLNKKEKYDDDDDDDAPTTKKRKLSSTTTQGSSVSFFTEKEIRDAKYKSHGFSMRCNHDVKIPLDGILPLEESNEVICLRCFLTLFYFDWDLSVTMVDYNKMINTIRNWMTTASLSTSVDIVKGIQKLVNCIERQLGAVSKRGLNWPLQAMNSGIFEYYTFAFSNLLEADRWRISSSSSSSSSSNNYQNGDMEPGLLYYKLNTFGKSLLLLMANCTVLEYDKDFTTTMTETLDKMRRGLVSQSMDNLLTRLPFSKTSGQWFNVQHRGPSIWRFQIYSMKIVGKECPSLSLESRRMIPTSPEDNECCKRILFKIHCRGSNLAKGGELVSDVCNSVLELQKMLNNKKYRLSFFDDELNRDSKGIDDTEWTTNPKCIHIKDDNKRKWMKIESAIIIGEPIISLEIINHRPLKCSQYKNGSLIANRLAILLNIRSGSRVKLVKSSSSSIILLEDLSSESASTGACDRLSKGSKILYYDIESTNLNPLADNAIITSIGCTLSRGDGTKERSIFAYGEKQKELKEKIIELYEKDDSSSNKMNADCNNVEMSLPIPNIFVAATELELLVNFTDYVNECKPLTAIAGWNSSAFDDPYLFISMYKYINHQKKPGTEKLLKGLFDFSIIVNDNSERSMKSDNISPMITNHIETTFNYQKKITVLEKLISCLTICPSLDMMKIIGKKFSETLPSMSLNTVLEYVCKISNTKAVQKDPIDVKYHLLEYRDRTIEENALVQKYCCKDAYLVSKPAERMGVLAEIIQLGKESNMSVSVVSAMYVTQLQIIDGAVLRAMGPERAFMRSCAFRPHSQYTKTLGGYVTTPLAKFQTLHCMDMGSLYPSAMRQNNLDTTTVCSHRQIVDCRNRRMMRTPFRSGTPEALAAMDEANAFIMARYRPCDLIVDSWKNNRKSPQCWITRQKWENYQKVDNNDNDDNTINITVNNGIGKDDKYDTTWDDLDSHNCINQVTDFGYFPEIGCSADLQLAALVNDDSHIELCGLEYMLPFLVPMVIDNPAIISEVTAGLAESLEDIVGMLEKDFTVEEERFLIETRFSYAGNVCKDNPLLAQSIEVKFEKALTLLDQQLEQNPTAPCDESLFVKREHACRLMSLCVRIARRVYVYDSARDAAVIKWSNRLLNVGNRCRIWNIKSWIRQGTIPLLQKRYREERVELKRQVKLKAKSDPLTAAQYKVEEGVKKIFMNSIYGVLVLRVGEHQNDSISRWKTDNSLSRLLVGHAASGVGGGTRHAPMGNQITQISRRIFLNISPSIRHFLPNCIQGYGDTDSVFLVHNFPAEMQIKVKEPIWHSVIEMDLVLRERIARLLQIIVNSTTKGIRFNPDLAAGDEAMVIEHECLSITTHTAGKKTYHMIHFREDEPLYINLVKTLVTLNETESDQQANQLLEDFQKHNPVSRFVSLVKNDANMHYVYPHNATELYRLFTTDKKAATLNQQSGGHVFSGEPLLPIEYGDKDIESIKKKLLKVLSASKYIATFKLEAVINALGNGFLEISDPLLLIDVRTGIRLSDPEKIADTLMALKIFKVYKKGKFKKKGISYASKLREIQTACLAWTQQLFFTYDTIVGEHAKRCLSYTENPEDYLTVSRVNKEQIPRKNGDIVTLPNPTARLINNHLNPSRAIELGEKFLTILAASGRTLVDTKRNNVAIKTLLHLPKKRWDPITERGVLAVSSVKNLGVVCHTTHSITELIKRDCESNFKIISWCLDSLHNVAKGGGFSLAHNALSYNTGILVSETLTRFLLSIIGKYKFTLSSTLLNNTINNNDDDDDDDDNVDDGDNDKKKKKKQKNIGKDNEDDDDDNTGSTVNNINTHNNFYINKNNTTTNNKNNIIRINTSISKSSALINPLLVKLNMIFTTLNNNQGKIGVPRILRENFNFQSLEEAVDALESIYDYHSSVFLDLKSFIRIWSRAREYKIPRHKNDTTPLSDIMSDNIAGPHIPDILKSCSIHVQKHSVRCKIKLIDTKSDDSVFLRNLILILGKDNCLETCVSAGASALLFNLLYCTFLRREREMYNENALIKEKESFEDICNVNERLWANKFYQIIKRENMVKCCFADQYNSATDSLVFLAEPKQWLSGMARHTMPNEMNAISLNSISTGIAEGSSLIRNNFVGPILDASNIPPFSKKTDTGIMVVDTNKDDSLDIFSNTNEDLYYNKNDSDGYYNEDEDDNMRLIFRPGFFCLKVVEKMFAVLGASVFHQTNVTEQSVDLSEY
uniref:DNA-directed DNA polymerase n=1 Tax=Marsupenaeus japonicus endogenous nimavirus TaxID=2133793 RepID=A0A401IP75_9VIRU|nr:wsv514-like protein [Marsupenaeus japonicus endogenous nimavirus]